MNKQEKLEKVIAGIRHEIDYGRGKCGHYCSEGKETVSCRYDVDGLCIQHWGPEAYTMLKAQQPRTMTLDDLQGIYNTKEDHTWPYDTPPYLYFETQPNQETPGGWHGWVAWRDIAWMLEEGYLHCNRENYGAKWLCWTSQPTDEQRKATIWRKDKKPFPYSHECEMFAVDRQGQLFCGLCGKALKWEY